MYRINSWIAPYLLAILMVFIFCSSNAWALEQQDFDNTRSRTGISFTIGEGGPGAIAAKVWDQVGVLIISCPSGVKFAAEPEISVAGDLKLDTANIRLNPEQNKLVIPILASSTQTSVIKFEQVNLTLDRTVPEGELLLSVSGNALDQASGSHSASWVGSIPIESVAAKGAVARVTTPAPDERTPQRTICTVGSDEYTLYDVARKMDVAPYLKDDRVFLPVYDIAQIMGIVSDKIFWDQEQQTITLMKGSTFIQLRIGSKTMLLNGAAVTLDAAPEITQNRTCLPVGLLVQALGGQAEWDPVAQTIAFN